MLAVFLTVPAHAQPVASSTSEKIDVQQFKPGPGAYDVLGLHSAKVGKHLVWNAGLSVSYATDPLSVLDPRADTPSSTTWWTSQLTVDVMGAICLVRSVRARPGAPFHLADAPGPRYRGGSSRRSGGKTGLGDVRVVPKANLYSTGGLNLGAAMPIHLPTGGARTSSAAGSPSVRGCSASGAAAAECACWPTWA